MTFVMFTSYILGMKVSLRTGIVAKESLATDNFHLLGRFFRNVLFYTVFFEGIGAVILGLFWMNDFSPLYALYLGIFHSVSTFCTAGFSTFSTSLMNYKSNILVNLTVNILSLIGGIGFFVLKDLQGFFHRKRKKILPNFLTLHSKVALIVTGVVNVIGFLVIFVAEKWPKGTALYDKILISSFQAISASTTDGYNSVDIGSMSAASLTILIVLMFIGASPGSTGGGMKTTTLGTLFAAIKSFFQGKPAAQFLHRELPSESVLKAFSLFTLFVGIAFVDITIMAITESASYLQTLFEIISALGNTGLSTGITSTLSFWGKLILTITMFIGRVGPLTIGTAFIVKKEQPFKYAKEDIFIG